MRQLSILLVCLLFSSFLYAQEATKNTYQLAVTLGAKFIPIDYLGGFAMGLKVQHPTRRLGFSFRRDISFEVKVPIYDANYRITRYQSFNYLTVDYQLIENLSVASGLAWIRRNRADKFDTKDYYAISVATSYQVDWLTIELRGDIPFENQKLIERGHAFPISMALTYNFTPKKRT